MTDTNVITVTGKAQRFEPPSFVLLSGLIEASAATLNLALDELNARSEATKEWLQRL